MWKEKEDLTVAECIQNCQVAKDVVRSMQELYGEALANYVASKQEWCRQYTNVIRKTILEKYDKISAHVLEYIEVHTVRTAEEMEKVKNGNAGLNKGNVTNQKSEFDIKETTKDLKFGIYGNVNQKSHHHKKVDFGSMQSQVPRQYASSPFIMRYIWTSYDYVTNPVLYYPDIVVVSIIQSH